MKHAEFSPSSASRWLNCPGSISLSRDIPPQPSSPYAVEGQEAHAVAEKVLKEASTIKSLPGLLAKRTKQFDKPKAKELQENLAPYVRFVREQFDKHYTQLSVERKVDILKPHIFGTVDVLLRGNYKLHVIDLKYGAGVWVDVVKNPQLLLYAMGGMNTLPKKEAAKKVTMSVVQPRCFSGDGGIIRSWTVPGSAIQKWFDKKVRPTIKNALSPDPRFKVGEHCRWCPAKPICTRYVEKAAGIAKVTFSENPKFPAPHTFKLTELSKILDFAKAFDSWLSDVKDFTRNTILSGTKVPGYKVVEGRAMRYWRDEAKTENFLSKVLGEKDAYTHKLLSPAQAEKVLPLSHIPKFTKLIETRNTARQLVPDTDKRTAIILSQTT